MRRGGSKGGPDAPSLIGWSFNYAHTSRLRSRKRCGSVDTTGAKAYVGYACIACSRSIAISAFCATPLLNLFQPVDTWNRIRSYEPLLYFFCSSYQFLYKWQLRLSTVRRHTAYFNGLVGH